MKLILTSIIRLFPSILDYDFIDKIVEGWWGGFIHLYSKKLIAEPKSYP
jgi:hypothetical protein